MPMMLTELQSLMLERLGITLPAPLPVFDSPPDLAAIEEWIACQPSLELQYYARKLSTHINYIPTERFLEQLKITLADFNQNHQEPYVLCLPQREDSADDKLSGCSDTWVIALAFEYAHLRWPEAIVRTDELEPFLESHSSVKKVLMLDDAAYSATHLISELGFISHGSPCELSVLKQVDLVFGIPFITGFAKNRILNCAIGNKIIFLAHDCIPVIGEILTDDEMVRFIEITNTPEHRTHSLTYFSHKYPDLFSTLQQFQTGRSMVSMEQYQALTGHYYDIPSVYSLDELDEIMHEHQPRSRPIVPYIASPYSYHRGRQKEALLQAICTENIGILNNNPLPDFIGKYLTNQPQLTTKSEPYIPLFSWNKEQTLSHEDYQRYKAQQCLRDEASFEQLIDQIKPGAITACPILRTVDLASFHRCFFTSRFIKRLNQSLDIQQ
jgi:hypothetical protein